MGGVGAFDFKCPAWPCGEPYYKGYCPCCGSYSGMALISGESAGSREGRYREFRTPGRWSKKACGGNLSRFWWGWGWGWGWGRFVREFVIRGFRRLSLST